VFGAVAGVLLGGIFGGGKGAGIVSFIGNAGGLGTTAFHGCQKITLSSSQVGDANSNCGPQNTRLLSMLVRRIPMDRSDPDRAISCISIKRVTVSFVNRGKYVAARGAQQILALALCHIRGRTRVRSLRADGRVSTDERNCAASQPGKVRLSYPRSVSIGCARLTHKGCLRPFADSLPPR
jgi:hypothetical protein